jgi:hypothetical protein
MKSEFPLNSTIILVHAAWADGSCWSNVILPLQQRGLHVICAPIPMTTLSDDAAALSRVRILRRSDRRGTGGAGEVFGLCCCPRAR